MIGKNTVAVVIPARGGSTRLKRKNVCPVWNKPMLFWAIKCCHSSQYIDEVYVSSEDAEILSLAMEFDAIPVQRPVELADNFTYKQEAIVHAVENMNEKFDIIVSMQANSPEISARDVDSAIEKLHVNDRNEIFSVDEDLIQNAAFRIMKYNYVFQKTISTRSGAFVTNYIDVHTVDDVNDLELNRSPSLHYNEVKNV